MGWKDTFTFLTPTFIEHEVQGQKLHFYPISVKFIFELKALGKPLAKALSTIFSNSENATANDTGATTQVVENTREGFKETKTVMDPIGVDIAILRDSQKREAFEEAFEAFSNQDNGMLIGRMLMDSLRDHFSDEERKDRNEALKFIQSLNFLSLRDVLMGFIKANAKVLGPLEDMAAQFSQVVMSSLPKKDDEEPKATIVPKAEKVQPETTGQTSPTQSPNLFSEESHMKPS